MLQAAAQLHAQDRVLAPVPTSGLATAHQQGLPRPHPRPRRLLGGSQPSARSRARTCSCRHRPARGEHTSRAAPVL
eukprot:13417879-Alexandrium_andersonii.AAC.1